MSSDDYFVRRFFLATVAVVLPLLGLIAYNLHAQQSEDKAAAARQVQARADSAAALLADEFQRVERMLTYIADLPELATGNAQVCGAVARGVVSTVALVNNVGAMDRDGKLRCIAWTTSQTPTNLLSEVWAQEILDAEDVHLVGPFLGSVKERWAILLGMPVRNSQGVKTGVVAASLDVQEIGSRLLSTQGMPDDSAMALLTLDGRLVASSEALSAWVGKPAATEVQRNFGAGGRGAFQARGHDGVERVIASATLPRYGLRVGAGVPTVSVHAAAQERFWRSAAVAAGILAIAVAMAVISARALSRPIRSLSATARELAAGHLLARADENLPGEFGDLAVEFNRAVAARLSSDAAQRAQSVAESASAAKSQFLASTSHEIRTPMNAIIGFSDLVLRGSLETRQREYVTHIRTAATSLLGIINDILDFSKIEAGRLELERVVFRLDDVIDRTMAIVARSAHVKGLEVMVSVADDVPCAMVGDPLRLQQVLLNLCSNAVKFTQAGEVELTVTRLAGGPLDRVVLSFSVRDTGQGLTDVQRARLFEAFAQGDASTTRTHGGTGLGLAIARRLVTLMSGRFEVRSAPGEGSTFSFTAEFRPCAIDEVAPRSDQLAGCRVLIVEAHDKTRAQWAQMLQHAGATVEGCADPGVAPTPGEAPSAALSARSVATSSTWDVVLIGRPARADALALAQQWMVDRPEARIVLVQAMAGPNVATPRMCHGCVSRPLSRARLIQVVTRALHPGADPWQAPDNTDDSVMGPLLQGKHILLVDDNEFNQMVAADLLTAVAGARVKVVSTGQAAVQAVAQEEHFDAILMDIEMPEMDGYDTVRRIRAMGRRAPIVAMTAHVMPGDIQRCLDAGMDAYIAKPFSPAELYTTLVGLTMDGGGSTSAPAPARPMVPPTAAAETDEPHPGGVDIEHGLQRCMGRIELYHRIAGRFVDAGRQDVTRMHTLLRLQDREGLRTLAHAAVSTAGTLGARRLASLSRALQAAILEERPDAEIAALVHRYDSEHADVLRGLQAYLQSPQAMPKTSVLSR